MNARFRLGSGSFGYPACHSINRFEWISQMTTLRLHQITARENRALLERLADNIRERLMRRAARARLLKLDDRMLNDIGLNRSSVMSDMF